LLLYDALTKSVTPDSSRSPLVSSTDIAFIHADG
jgi:hypothetical protein